ncbi:hypothetical protein V6N13_139511 [Hibiscus sabdariffa]
MQSIAKSLEMVHFARDHSFGLWRGRSDFVGKSLTAIYVLQSIKKDTWGFIARLLFYLLSTACLHGPKWLKGEIPVAVLTAYVYAWTD